MNSLGLSLIFKMGCLCSKETVVINNRKYTIRESLGQGGFSTVYLVEDNITHKKYALKKIMCHSSEDELSATKEVEYHSMLKHPNIIKCVDYTQEGIADPVTNATSEILILLPYYRRGTLADELGRRSISKDYFTSLDALTIFLQICEGVKTFHEAKPEPLAHRDLKTANIVLDDGMTPIIMDLGSVAPARLKVSSSQAAQSLQDTAAERCSMPYRAPELFNVESYSMVDERTDIWSLGCILYALCYFKSPFEAVYERGDSVALAVINANITFPENAPYTENIHELIRFMMKVDPMERPYIYSVIEKVSDEISTLQARA